MFAANIAGVAGIVFLLSCASLTHCAPWPVPNQEYYDYMPREIASGEDFALESPPSAPSENLEPPPPPPPTFSPQIASEEQTEYADDFVTYSTAQVPDQDSYQAAYQNRDQFPDKASDKGADFGESANKHWELADDLQPPSNPAEVLISYEPLFKKYFGPKSPFYYDKDTVGIAGKENRFRRDVSDRQDASSVSYSQSSASAGSSADAGSVHFPRPEFSAYPGVFGRDFSPFAGNSELFRSASTLFDQDSSYHPTGHGFGLGQTQGFASDGAHGIQGQVYFNSPQSSSGEDGSSNGLQSRFGGGGDGGGGVGIGASVSGDSRGTFSETSSSVDENGKTVLTVRAGHIKQ